MQDLLRRLAGVLTDRVRFFPRRDQRLGDQAMILLALLDPGLELRDLTVAVGALLRERLDAPAQRPEQLDDRRPVVAEEGAGQLVRRELLRSLRCGRALRLGSGGSRCCGTVVVG